MIAARDETSIFNDGGQTFDLFFDMDAAFGHLPFIHSSAVSHVFPEFRSERFRTPLAGERSLGMWVDRIGAGTNLERTPNALRVLGLYAVVAIEDGEGYFISSTSSDLVEKAISFINQSIDGPVCVEDVAKNCGVSAPQFRRLFKTHTGGSPKEFIINQKINKAKNFLRNVTPVKQIADQLGYQDEFYFRKVFKKVTGKTPGKFH